MLTRPSAHREHSEAAEHSCTTLKAYSCRRRSMAYDLLTIDRGLGGTAV